jgi:peptide/nickel transport system substrate-binding protein
MTRIIKNHFISLMHRKISVLMLVFLIGITSCTGDLSNSERHRRITEDGKVYGGVLRINMSEEIRSIFPHNIVDASAFTLMNQVYEGLVYLEHGTNELKPAIAESYTISPDGKTYRFVLRQDVFFHDDKIFEGGKGRQVKAEDVAYCFTRLCEPAPYNQLYAFVIDIISGGRTHYESVGNNDKSLPTPSGIKVISEFVIEIELEYANSTFLTILTHPCCWIFPRELYSYGNDINTWSIGTGPFRARTIKMNDVFILEKNRNYWKRDNKGNTLPFLDAIRCNFIRNEEDELNEFNKGNLDLLFRIPFKEVAGLSSILEKDPKSASFFILTAPGLRTEYYGFQHRVAPYDNELVRKAFNYAIDREAITNDILMGYGIPANHGFVPPSLPGYKGDTIEGFGFDPDRAKDLLAQAGYVNGEGFPVVTLQLNDGNATALRVAEKIQEMLSTNLNLTIELAALPRDKHYDSVELGSVGFWRDGWIADYPDPENFLKLFHGKLVPDENVKVSYLNTVRFKNPRFDNFFETALRENDPEKRRLLMVSADAEVINRAAVIPLYHEKWVWLVSNRVNNLYIGTMGELNVTEVFIEPTQVAKQPAL